MALHSFKHALAQKEDNYFTPRQAWEDIKQYIPKKTIWECFYGDGKSGSHLKDMGFDVICENVDFFENDMGEILVSNPPFSLTKQVLTRLFQIDKPFIMIMPSSKINTQYFREWKDKGIQIIIPKKRIQFIKHGVETQGNCSFDCFYYCYKINLETDIIWL